MGWQALGEDELTGDSAVAIAKAAVDKLLLLRTEGGRPAVVWDDLAGLLTQAVARSTRELVTRKNAKFSGLTVAFEGGASLETTADETKPVADELAIFRDAVKKIALEYKEVGERLNRKRPTANEVTATFQRATAEAALGETETRKPTSITPRFDHEDGMVPAQELVEVIAAAMRRNERRLGLLVENGATMSPDAIVAVSVSGATVRADVEEAKAARTLVEDMCDRMEKLVSEHRQEQPEKHLSTLSAPDRDRYQRNVDARGVPTLEVLIEKIRRELGRTPERYEPLTSLKVETSERSGIGLPSRPAPKKFVDSRVRVRHVKFGEGFVERTFEDGEKKYEVLFDNGKRVTLMAHFLEELS